MKRSGHRYTSKPFITVDSNTGWGAYVEPILNSKGYLTRVRVIRPGKGYTGKTRPDTTICQLVGFHLTNVGGLYTSAPNVYVNGKPVHRQGDRFVPHTIPMIPPPPPHPDIMGVGSNARVFVNGKLAATLGTPTVQGGLVVVGSHSVFM